MTARSGDTDSAPITLVHPVSGWKNIDVRELWTYRELYLAFCRRDIMVRYRQTVLGATWAILQPLITMVIFTIIFGRLAKIPSDGFPYPIFVYAGLLPWLLFAATVSAGASATVGSAQMVSKIYFPRLLIPLSAVGSPLVDFAVASIILLLMMLVYGMAPGWQLLYLPLLLAGTIATALGVGTLVSALTVSYRDFRYVVPFMVQIWMYLTPVVYPVSFIPDNWRWLLYLNPMTGYTDGFRTAWLGGDMNLPALISSLVMSFGLLLFGLKYYRKVEQRFADII